MSRIGLLVPSSNTTIEPEIYRALPRNVTLHAARLYLTRIATESIADILEDIETQSRNLASADVDVVVLGATAPSFLKGLGYDREVTRRIEQGSGRRATTTSTALLDALRHLGISRVALGAAYDERVNGIARRFLEANDFEVVHAKGLGLVDNLAVGRLEPSSARELARAIDRPEAQAIVLACTNWKTMDILDEVEQELGKPVLSTTQVTLWTALRMIGHTNGLEGYGSLLQKLLPVQAG